MVQVGVHLSTGLPGLDRILRGLIPGDNIVWQVASVDQYAHFIEPYYQSAQQRGRPLVYFRFASHPALLSDRSDVEIHTLDPHAGVEAFIADVHRVVEKSERGAWYVFDCLSELAVIWRSDTMLGNFFVLTCPYLYDVDAIAYFGLIRHFHASEAIAPIMDTTQVFLNVYRHKEDLYVHPVKVQQRHSPTMYMLHAWQGDDFRPVADSATTAEILSATPCLPMEANRSDQGVWHGAFRLAEETLDPVRRTAACEEEARRVLRQLLQTAFARDPRMLRLLERYLTIEDVLAIRRRIIGTGLIGGKAIGMLLARAILKRANPDWNEILEIHDSFYVGSDVFYTFLVQNGLWWEWRRQRNPDRLLRDADHARQRIVVGKFPDYIQAQFQTMLHYFGQSPIIVRSSSLLEDSFGHSFAGKYESVFLANQGSPDQRLHDLTSAVRTIYASTMGEEALTYRARRGMLATDEQMALLVQRVSGAVHEKLFFPHLAGVGFSYNPYVWSNKIDPRAGVLRLVFGLGTRAVDRTDDDYARVVSLNAPRRQPVAGWDDALQYVQRRVDVLDLQANQLVTRDFGDVAGQCPDVPIDVFASRDERITDLPAGANRRERFDRVLTFDALLEETDYVTTMRRMLREIEDAYECPVDVEFTTNFRQDDTYRINLVQCRPLQVKSEGAVGSRPQHIEADDLVLKAHGAVIGHGRICNVDRIIYVVPSVYGRLPLRDRYSVARLIGKLARLDRPQRPETIMLLGPGRWGTSMPSLGVPVSFGEISRAAVLGEIVVMHDNLIPDVSLGTHFFNELVEADILYFALFPERDGNTLNSAFLRQSPNRLPELAPEDVKWSSAVRVIDTPASGAGRPLVLHANTVDQEVVCYLGGQQ